LSSVQLVHEKNKVLAKVLSRGIALSGIGCAQPGQAASGGEMR